MREPTRGTRLAEKALPDDRILREVGRQRFDCHATIEPHVAREIDDSHAAAADLTLEIVLAFERGGEATEFL
jgi:hypothetical protein